MKDVSKFKIFFFIIVPPLTYLPIIFLLQPRDYSIINLGYDIAICGIGILILFVSIFLKKFNLLIIISFISITGYLITFLYFKSFYLSGYFLYSMAFAVMSSDAIYSVANRLYKTILFLSSFSVFLLILFLFNLLITNLFVKSTESTNDIKNILEIDQKENTINEDFKHTSDNSSDTSKKNEYSEIPTGNSLTIESLIKNNYKAIITNDITEIIYQWKNAWEKKNITAIRSFLTNDYKYIGADNKEILLNERIKKMQKTFRDYKYINIEIKDIKFTIEDNYPNDITVEFIQIFKSNIFNDAGKKTLKFYKGKSTKNKWKIYKEYFEFTSYNEESETDPSSKKVDYLEIGKTILKYAGIVVLIIIFLTILRKIFK
jgi:hypothetical protein